MRDIGNRLEMLGYWYLEDVVAVIYVNAPSKIKQTLRGLSNNPVCKKSLGLWETKS